jgi:hypothetical protein
MGTGILSLGIKRPGLEADRSPLSSVGVKNVGATPPLPIRFHGYDSSVGTASGYGLEDRGVGVRVPVESRIFFSLHHPDRLWGPLNLLSNGYWGLFPRG